MLETFKLKEAPLRYPEELGTSSLLHSENLIELMLYD
jgi:hypothetical protein